MSICVYQLFHDNTIQCDDVTAALTLSAGVLRAALAKLSTEFIAAGLDK